MSEFPLGSSDSTERSTHVEGARREAQERRRVQEAAAARPSIQRFYWTALAGLGLHLAAWGVRLQERYSTEESTPTPGTTPAEGRARRRLRAGHDAG
jgi:hypothetical protein